MVPVAEDEDSFFPEADGVRAFFELLGKDAFPIEIEDADLATERQMEYETAFGGVGVDRGCRSRAFVVPEPDAAFFLDFSANDSV